MATTVRPAASAVRADPFTGPASVRLPHEWLALGLSVVVLLVAAALLKWFTQSDTLLKEVALLLVVGMLYVTLSRGRLLGGSIRVHAGQFGHVYEIVEECSRKMRMATPQVFVRDDPFVPIVGVGIGDPYAIIISAQWVDHLTPDELRFLIGRELGHIGGGHTRISSLLSINGRENALIAIIFGAPGPAAVTQDLSLGELAPIVVLAAGTILFGLFPQLLILPLATAVDAAVASLDAVRP